MKLELPIKFLTMSGAILTAIAVADYGYSYAMSNWQLTQLLYKLIFNV